MLVRCDLNVPLSKSLEVTDDTRIRGSIPTIQYLVSKGAKVIPPPSEISFLKLFFNYASMNR